jgi:hypothetical protein
LDNGGIIKIPTGHVWLECDNSKERHIDSISTLGPISKKFILGEAMYTVWPWWRMSSFRDLERYKVLVQHKPVIHSKAFTNQQIYDKYGL